MNSIKARLKHLEAALGASPATAIIMMPMHWDEKRRRAAIARLAKGEPVVPMLIEDPKATEAKLTYLGDLDALLAQVAQNSGRIGQPPN